MIKLISDWFMKYSDKFRPSLNDDFLVMQFVIYST